MDIVGREPELAAVERLLAATEPTLRALVLEGEPGIGKTTVWETVAPRAAALGLSIVSCRPVQAEAKLAYASLADLLSPLVDDGVAALPEPQRFALEVALLRALPGPNPPDQRAVATAAHSLLRRAAAEAPLVMAIDDAQWLDAASAAALAFALRRLADAPLRVLLAVRAEEGKPPASPLGLSAERVRLGPLSLSGIHHVLKVRLDRAFPRPTLRRIAEASAGNPLLAVELGRALDVVGARPGPGEPLPVPETLAALLQRRVARLPEATRDALLAAAALADPEVELLGEEAAALDSAVRDGVVSVLDGRVRFAHPLLASTVYSSASPRRRREVHARLAAVVRDTEEQARHLGLAAAGPDERAAARLQAAARDANARAAAQAAAELAGLAVGLTPAERSGERAERTLELVEYVFRAGDAAEARRLTEVLLEELAPGPLRARVLEVLARLLHVAGTAHEAVACCEQALTEAGGDLELEALVHTTLARVAWDDLALARRHSELALEQLGALHDPPPLLLGAAVCAHVSAVVYSGEPLPTDLVERGLELERVARTPDVADRVSAALGAWLKHVGDFEQARSWLEATRRAALDEGDDASLPYALSHLPQLDLWTGRWAEAEAHAREHLQVAEETSQPSQRRQALYNLALVHAHLGRVAEARAEAETLLAEGEATADVWDESNGYAVLGFLELSVGDAAGAAAALERALALRDAISAGEPLRSHGDLAEAYLRLGDHDRAELTIRTLEERARAAGRAPLLAIAAARRALLEAARGDLDAAAAAVEEALAQHARVSIPFDLSRTLVAAGQVRRRRGERRLARDALEQARVIFESLGAQLWAAQAANELQRIPIRRGGGDALTPTEERVAELVAAGHTNREVAQALFMSPKTVEANLGRIYRKLGVASRAQLGAHMAGRTAAKP